jgi:ABC-type polysaccharide/polyol phosphate transport system ATPase subunit
MMMRLAFSIATLVEPEILIVDEILSVGDAHFAEKSGKRMRELMEGGTTVIMVSHIMEQIEKFCNRVIWLENGKIIMDGLTDKVCQAYLKNI